MLNEKVLDAFLSAGVPEDKARAAAVALAESEPRFTKLEARLDRIESELTMIKWMMGVHVGLTAGILFKLLTA